MKDQLKKAIPFLLGMQLAVAGTMAQSTSDLVEAIDAERYAKANSLAKSLIASKPDDAVNYYYLGKLYLGAGYVDSARAIVQKGIAANEKEPLNYVGLGAADLGQNDVASAKANFDKAISLTNKKSDATHIAIGNAYLDASKPDYAAAAASMNAAIAIDSKDAVAYVGLGDALKGEQKYTEAYNAYTRAVELDKSLLRAKIGLGLLVKQSTAYEEAAEQFTNVIALDPDYAPAYRELAETYYLWANNAPKLYEEKIRQALEYYKQYMARTDQSLDSRMRYADFLILAKDYKTLEGEAKAMAGNEKTNLRVYRYLGYAAFENGNYPESVSALTNFITTVDSSRIIGQDYLYLGKAQLKTGAVTEAAENLRKAVKLDPVNAEGISDLAKSLYTARQYADAAKIYEIAVSDSTSRTIAYDNFYLGLANYFDYGEKVRSQDTAAVKPDSIALRQTLAAADTAFSTVITLSPTSPDAYLYRARVRRLLDDPDHPVGLMVPDYEKYVAIITEKPDWASDAIVKKYMVEAYSYLASSAVRQEDQINQAIDYLNKVKELDPANEYANATLKSLQAK
jgi:tetratricopeptide (TPR) repeat protein